MTKGRKSSLEETIGGVNSDGCPASGMAVHVTAVHNGPLKEYDPFEEMSAEKPTTYQETLFNFVKQNLGTGILAMPNAFYHSGYLLGPICTVAIILFSVYCKHLQLRVNYSLCKKKKVASMSFRDTIGNACAEGPPFFQKLGPHMQVITDIAIVVGQMGTGIVYFVFIGSNLKKVCDEYYEPLDQRLYMAAILVPLVLMNYLHSYKFLAPISLVTNVVTLAGYGVILYYIFTDLHPLATRSAVGTMANIPLFLGTVLFVYETVSFVIPMRREMKHPRRFASKLGVFHVGTVVVSVLYLTIGFFGYLAYGADALGSVTLNLPLREVTTWCSTSRGTSGSPGSSRTRDGGRQRSTASGQPS
ncbi:proton-coupled amino acid transporter-like protein CG1139 isoform X2 [Bacillus rossius redtenbacheri]|uniref:proton-coupled amino acid transporter-like protein CG1139 isoform X2 n=1 Tax=Bacillus rossius redtenbacheri TaxID=93214 RepID=UPI002FDC99F8